MKVLVCGGRRFRDAALLREILDKIHMLNPIKLLVNGGAAGADTLAASWAVRNLVPVKTEFAEWNRYGNDAGPIRNKLMLDRYAPDLVVAFEGGSGTKNMLIQAQRAKVKRVIVTGPMSTELLNQKVASATFAGPLFSE